MVKFCPKCGSLMTPRVKDGKRLLVCNKCGYEEEAKVRITLSKRIEHTEKEKTIIIESSADIPRTTSIAKNVECPKCGNTEAYVWIVQTRAADEPPTRIYKCTKCHYSWREYE